MNTIRPYCNKLIFQILDSKNEVDKKLVFFIGEGCSQEYGMPTVFELALKAFTDINTVFILPPEDSVYIEKIYQEFQQNHEISDEDFAKVKKIFMQEVATLSQEEKRKLATQFLKSTKDSLSYKILVNLWRSKYIDLVITNNVDDLIEDEIRKLPQKPYLAVFDYNDLNQESSHRNLPSKMAEQFILIKIAGDFYKSSILYNQDEFRDNITYEVQEELKKKIANNPLVLLGYNVDEKEMEEIVSAKEDNFLAIVHDKESLKPNTGLSNLYQQREKSNTIFVSSGYSNFFSELIDTLFDRTQDKSLIYSFN
jgi:hypothetical protein